ncbi:polyribonucleotide nucleotidyltransferase [Hydrogenispora ethanolica]|jgi:polyribonucleotide nucleotidyltransferase|uniref:Polyribonucleotide nucleotidyltransferase n=1 Tax=Hydrogenispora ethanolica TaxID=1082276 RepID=A0A4R1R7D9_HYDET|nr:polyribonucleotide nucleotidyltransferase [Hydrogenispora ethanolica]TCL61524.1 polyribonucleotide nucleotidyltransferase [Hydrogenispora ethanolica]
MQTWEMNLAGRTLSIEYGRVAKQASAAVLARYGDTVVLVTAAMAAKPREGIDFFPLLVDYEERLYAVGKIPGGFIKREGRPPESAVLAARMIDRPIRPLFPEGFRNDVQVVATVLSVEPDNEPSLLAMIGASAALHISDIPFAGPIGGVKVGRVDGKLVINPTVAQMEKTDMQITVAGTKEAVMMVEAGTNEITEDDALEAILYGHSVIQEITEFIEKIRAEVGKPKIEVNIHEPSPELNAQVREFATAKMVAAIKTDEKLEREALIEEVKEATRAHFSETLDTEYAAAVKDIEEILESIVKEEVRKMIVIDKIRPDGRGLAEIRPITCEVGILPRTHGSGLFTRGQTQVLTVCTLGRVSEEQILDGLGEEESKRYIHHYNFPPYSVGEVRPSRSPGRREIGHGALAERALLPVIPSEDSFPYTIRLVSEVLESNGSSSQASVCGSTLALMDAGVPIRKPVAGVAMGLLKYGDDFTILTDIQGMEDHFGDMDFKVAGTKDGITAIQMDIKIKGIGREILKQALAQAREGRLFILGKMLAAISEPRQDLSPYAPRIITFDIDPDRIRDVIGPGGKMIRKIIEETGTEIDIEDDGRVFIAAVDATAGSKAQEMIKRLTSDVEIGATYLGKVTRLMNFGAFVEVLPGKEGLVHISQLAKERVAKVEDVVNVGDEIMVKVIEIDKQGRVNLSRKALLMGDEAQAPQPTPQKVNS